MSEDIRPSERIEAVALLRVPEWDVPEEVDVRFVDDGALVFLPVDYDADPNDLLEALLDAVGDVAYDHDDERGVFFLPDFAEPDDAKTYDAVIAAVADEGKWVDLDAPAAPDLTGLLGGNAETLIGQAFQAMGISDPKSFMQAMQSGDPETMKLAQIQVQGKLEEMMKAARGDAEKELPEAKESGEKPAKS